jgi:hypothetical protein
MTNDARRPRSARPGYISRVLRMSVVLAVFIAWAMLSLGRFREAGSFLVGAAAGVGMLWVLRFAVAQALSGKRTGWRKKAFAGGLAVVKYGLLCVLLWWFVRQPWTSVPAFAAGAAMTQVVLLLKALVSLLAPPEKQDPYST